MTPAHKRMAAEEELRRKKRQGIDVHIDTLPIIQDCEYRSASDSSFSGGGGGFGGGGASGDFGSCDSSSGGDCGGGD